MSNRFKLDADRSRLVTRSLLSNSEICSSALDVATTHPRLRAVFDEKLPSFLSNFIFDDAHLIDSVILSHRVFVNDAFSLFAPPIDWLSSGAKRIVTEENAGGASEWSEGISFEILKTILPQVSLSQTEMEIDYWWPNWAKTDYSIWVKHPDGNGPSTRLGVSVTRAVTFGDAFAFDEISAAYLLVKKLHGVIESTKGVVQSSEFQRQILHVLTPEEWIANMLRRVWDKLLAVMPHLCGNTIVVVSVVLNEKTSDAEGEVKIPWIFYPNYKVDAFRKLNTDESRDLPRVKMKKKKAQKQLAKRRRRKQKMIDSALEWTDGIPLTKFR